MGLLQLRNRDGTGRPDRALRVGRRARSDRPSIRIGLEQFEAQAPFSLIMRRDLWQQNALELADRYPSGRIRNVTPDGTRVALEVPAA